MNKPAKTRFAGLTAQEEAEARHLEFADSFGSDGFFEEALITCLQKIDRICAVYFGDAAAKAGLDTMVGRYFPELVEKGGWAFALEEKYSGIYSELPIGTQFHDLDAYANYGIVLAAARDVETRGRVILPP